jgi:Protein of unknown function (DUF4245)
MNPSGRMNRIPVAIAGLALAAVTLVACGDDSSDDTTASDHTTPTSTSSSPTTAVSPTASDSPSASESSATGDPVASPIINKAVKDAIRADFPALVPSGVPAGWTVVSAAYAGHGGGVWQVALTDPDGAPVTLMQSTAASADLAARLLPGAKASGAVKLSGTGKWTTYAGTSGAALGKDLSGTGAVVVGPDAATVKALADQLLTAEDSGSSDGG